MIEKTAGMRGSRRAMCEWVNDDPLEFESYFHESDCFAEVRAHGPLDWLSPLRKDNWRELRDGLWNAAGLPDPSPQAAGWWPPRGPQWDGVGIVRDLAGATRGVLLVEAKSHLDELDSSPTSAEGERLTQIEAALTEVKEYLGGAGEADWARRYYQLTNRLAYLYYLRVRLGFPACLLFVYFLGESFGRPGARMFPATEAEWRPAIDAAKNELGIAGPHKLARFTFEVFPPATLPRKRSSSS